MRDLRDDMTAPVPIPGMYRLLWIVLLILVTIDALWLIGGGIPFKPEDLGPYWLLTIPFATIALVYSKFRPEPRLSHTATACATLFAFCAPALLFSQLMISLQQPLFDDTLANWDIQLGLDWQRYMRFVTRHAIIAQLLEWLYHTVAVQVFLLIFVYGLTGRSRSLDRLVCNLIISAIIADIIGGFAPALGYFTQAGAGDPTGIGPYVQSVHDGNHIGVQLTDYRGTITFPSFHTMICVAIILSAWPVRYLRWPVTVFNIALLAGVPIYGSHYFVDMIAGAVIACVVDAAISLLQTGMPRRVALAPAT